MIVPALLGLAILTETTPAFSRIQNRANPPHPGAAPALDRRTGAEPENSNSGPFRVLTGVIAYTDPKQGFAIIGNSVHNTFVVRPGQQLPDGSMVREIHPKHVVLEHGGSLEALGMYGSGENAGTNLYTPAAPPLPQQGRWEVEGVIEPPPNPAGAVIPRPVVPVPTEAGDLRRSESPTGEPRLNDLPPGTLPSGNLPLGGLPSSDALAKDALSKDAQPREVMPKQLQPEPLSPQSQDPADEFGADGRRADSLKK